MSITRKDKKKLKQVAGTSIKLFTTIIMFVHKQTQQRDKFQYQFFFDSIIMFYAVLYVYVPYPFEMENKMTFCLQVFNNV